MREMKKMIIGIDPDCKESGVAVLTLPSKEINAHKLTFSELIDTLTALTVTTVKKTEIYIEGGWLNKSNWHAIDKHMSVNAAAEVGRRTGMNHQTGILIAEMCKNIGLNYHVVKPLKKCWKGKDGKITQDEAKYFMGNLPRMNQDQRDAALLAWVYAGLTVKVKPNCAKTR